MATLRAFLHIGRVECVTCHVPVTKERGGAKSEEDEDAVAPGIIGARILMLGALFGASATPIA
jgi:ferredoxin